MLGASDVEEPVPMDGMDTGSLLKSTPFIHTEDLLVEAMKDMVEDEVNAM